MAKEVQLYHVSYAAEIEDVKKEGLSPDYVQTCIGGQMEGIYFFSKKNWCKEWMWRNRYTAGGEGYICTASIPEEEISFPNWRLDLFFNQGIIDDLSSSLKRYYAPKADKNGVVRLDNLESKYAISGTYGDGDFFFDVRTSNIVGLKFKNGQCMALYTEKGCYGEGLQRINSAMDEDFYGFADTLLEHMCQKDPKLLKQYNRKLRHNVFSYFKHGAVKYLGDQNIPVTIEPYSVWENPLYYVSGFLMLSQIMALTNEFRESPVHKRIPEAFRQITEHYQEQKRNRERLKMRMQRLKEMNKKTER